MWAHAIVFCNLIEWPECQDFPRRLRGLPLPAEKQSHEEWVDVLEMELESSG